ncbi:MULTISPECIES: hypothetical protein [Pectobacterium]|uniref:hypothetical protein n=1 Tax=Pectobacterium TaxID=122277 RepID=UPI001CD42049|nr:MULTISPECIES: hypothetical protein [Pectobacterium]UPY96245.1 hypothetical protein MYB54_05935 [Pectobacterium sp. 21LCBS03]
MKIVTRLEAAKGGMNKFYTGKPCKHGHLSERWTLNGGCVQCNIDRVEQKRKEISGLMKAAQGGD